MGDRCGCGRLVVMKTSWTEANPGRRFLTCGKNQGAKCGYFRWFDPSMCVSSKVIIPGLLRRVRIAEMRKLRGKSLWIALLLSWIVFAFILFAGTGAEIDDGDGATVNKIEGNIAIVGNAD